MYLRFAGEKVWQEDRDVETEREDEGWRQNKQSSAEKAKE